MLDTERNTLALGVDRKYGCLDLLALLVVPHGFFARHFPGNVREVNQSVDAAVQTNEDTEVGNRLDLARNLVVTIERRGELGPGIRLALLDTKRDATPLLVDLEHHDLDFLSNRVRYATG